jgi:hypothetical protein
VVVLKCRGETMKKILMIGLLFSFSLAISSCQEDPNEENNEIQLIQDRYFKNGFIISPADNEPQPDNRYPLDYELTYGEPDGQISWLLGQAGDRYGLADEYAYSGKEVEKIGDNYIIEDTSKSLTINPETGEITFELNTSEEYLAPRESKDAWPHLLLQQGLSENLTLNQVDTMNLSLGIELNKLDLMMTDEEYDSSLHTAQFLMYIVVRTNAALDANEYMWFGIPFLDARYTLMQENGLIDAGTAGNTGKFIYQMPQGDFMPNGMILGEEVIIDVDLMPYFGRALMLAQQNGALLNSTIDDLYVTNMNIGYEIPGTYDVSITMRDFSLVAVLKDE